VSEYTAGKAMGEVKAVSRLSLKSLEPIL